MKQKSEERFDFFLQRLREQTERCETGTELTKWMLSIRIVEVIRSNEARRKLLEKEHSLEGIIGICRGDEVLKVLVLNFYSTDAFSNHLEIKSNFESFVDNLTFDSFVMDCDSDGDSADAKGSCVGCGEIVFVDKDESLRCKNCKGYIHVKGAGMSKHVF